jgi:hypothetical protein
MKKLFLLLLVCLFMAFAGQVKANEISIVNYSFETPDIANGSWNGPSGPIPSWTWVKIGGSGGGSAVKDPGSGDTFQPIDGGQYGLEWCGSGGYLYQTLLGEQVQTGMTYTLTGYFGQHNEKGTAAGTLGLYTANGTPLVVSASFQPSGWSWDSLTVTYVANSTYAGETLQIRLNLSGVSGNYAAWDDIHLTKTNPVPLPGAILLLGSGLAVLGSLKWRRRQKP